MAASTSRARLEEQLERIDKKLHEITGCIAADPLNVSAAFDKTLWETDKRIRKTTKDIVVVPKLSPEQTRIIAEKYSETTAKPIKGWAQKEVEKLRKLVRKRVLDGGRADELEKILVKSWGLGKSKAKSVARQETKLMQAAFVQSRAQSAGIDDYKWECVKGTPLHPVRPRHKELNDMSQLEGKIFQFSKPPRSTDKGQPARYNNPGEDYFCRCKPRLVIKF